MGWPRVRPFSKGNGHSPSGYSHDGSLFGRYSSDRTLSGGTLAEPRNGTKRLINSGLRLRLAKCTFLQKEISYLGHNINRQGLTPVKKTVMAIQASPKPKNVMELRFFLGMINYYGRFIPKLASRLPKLYQLLRQSVRWLPRQWKDEHEEAFRRAKVVLQSSQVMIHFDPRKEVILACDASPYGVGAVLSHRLNDSTERPIAFVSRSLAEAERRYAQIDREALALLFEVKKFHQYMSGRAFPILTDHKPLVSLLGENKGVPLMASGRM